MKRRRELRTHISASADKRRGRALHLRLLARRVIVSVRRDARRDNY